MLGKGRFRMAFLYFLVVFLFIVLNPSVAICAESNNVPAHIILISVDGLNYEKYASIDKESLHYLSLDGVSTNRCLAVKADTIEAGEASLLTGSQPDEHKHYGYKDQVAAESLLNIFKESGRSVLLVDGSGGKLRGFAHGQKEYVKMAANKPDSEIMKKASDLFFSRRPYFTYIYLNDCRMTMMEPSNQEYYGIVRDIDIQVGNLMKKLKDHSMYDDTLLVVTASRSTSESDMVPLIMEGPRIKENSTIEGSYIVDVAPTICALAKKDIPITSTGLVLWNTFQPDKENRDQLQSQRIEDLQKERLKVWKKYYGMVDERDRYSHQIAEIKEERENIFNFAGERERTVADLKNTLNKSKGIAALLGLVLLLGYFVEYRYLRKKFMIFH